MSRMISSRDYNVDEEIEENDFYVVSDMMTRIMDRVIETNNSGNQQVPQTPPSENYEDNPISENWDETDIFSNSTSFYSINNTNRVNRNLLNEFRMTDEISPVSNTINLLQVVNEIHRQQQERRQQESEQGFIDFEQEQEPIHSEQESEQEQEPETEGEKKVAESLREIMAIIFDNKEVIPSKDYLDMTNLLKLVYEIKDPIKLKEDIENIKYEYNELYDEFCSIMKDNKYYTERNVKLKRDNNALHKRLQKIFNKYINQKKKNIELKEDISDFKYENDRMWGTKFYYQNKLLKLAEKHPEVLDNNDKQEVAVIKKRKAMENPKSILDVLSPVKVNLTSLINGECKVNLEVQEAEELLGDLFKEDTVELEKNVITYVRLLDPDIIVENVPIIEKERIEELCKYLTNKKSINRLWKSRPKNIKIEVNHKTGLTTGRAIITFYTPTEASMAVRKSNNGFIDRKHKIKTFIKV